MRTKHTLPYASSNYKPHKIRNQHFCEEVFEYVKYPLRCFRSFHEKDLFLLHTLPDHPFLSTEQVRGHCHTWGIKLFRYNTV